MEEKKKEIICDGCGIDIMGMGMQIKDRVIAEDESKNPVIERYFDCMNCGKHYTITVIDREMRLMIQKRQQLQNRIIRMLKGGTKLETIDAQKEAVRILKADMMYRAAMLKETYLKEKQ